MHSFSSLLSPPLPSFPFFLYPSPTVQNTNVVRAMQEKVRQAIHQGLVGAPPAGNNLSPNRDLQEVHPYAIVPKSNAKSDWDEKNLARYAHAGAAGVRSNVEDHDTEISVVSPRTSVDCQNKVLMHSGPPARGTQVNIRAPKDESASGDADRDDDTLAPSSAQPLLSEVMGPCCLSVSNSVAPAPLFSSLLGYPFPVFPPRLQIFL